jgi:endo-1,3(4)-beta-glucanase
LVSFCSHHPCVRLDLGPAFYNDHHFHYGYHIYAAAAVAHFDPKWGRKHFEQVMLYIRDIANPSKDDEAFPTFRQKDWYQGSSWASGIAVSPLNGRNQESSSESIAAYEAIGLYGKEMMQAFKHDSEQAAVAKQVFNYGQLLTASEIRSAQKYWHVLESSHDRQYPKEYTPHVIGMLWTNMAQFQTWFGNHPYLAIGIQLLPLTAVSEERDSVDWVLQMYQEFADSCDSQAEACEAQGWSVLVMAMLATVGHRDEAMDQALALNTTEVFNSAGGNGHSLTNTLWYLSTRPFVEHPLGINVTSVEGVNSTSYGNADGDDDEEYSDENDTTGSSEVCPPCSEKVCRGEFNKCPVQNAPYLCTEGQNTGGCSRAPWTLGARSCVQCCEVTYGCEN